jgi:hypothetical protein
MAAAQSVVGRARADEQRARAALDLATSELKRERVLAESGATARQALEAKQTAAVTAEEGRRAAEFAVAAANADLERARARLQPSTLEAGGRVLPVLAPVDGVVLRRFRKRERRAGGEPLVEIGGQAIADRVDLLSTDAVNVSAGCGSRWRVVAPNPWARGSSGWSRSGSRRSRPSASKSSA